LKKWHGQKIPSLSRQGWTTVRNGERQEELHCTLRELCTQQEGQRTRNRCQSKKRLARKKPKMGGRDQASRMVEFALALTAIRSNRDSHQESGPVTPTTGKVQGVTAKKA